MLSPLVAIEQAVQDRAKDISLEMDSPDGAAKLRALIDEEVARWGTDYQRGLRSYDLADPELVAERAHRNLAGDGPLAPLLEDDDVWEVMINAPMPHLRYHAPRALAGLSRNGCDLRP